MHATPVAIEMPTGMIAVETPIQSALIALTDEGRIIVNLSDVFGIGELSLKDFEVLHGASSQSFPHLSR